MNFFAPLLAVYFSADVTVITGLKGRKMTNTFLNNLGDKLQLFAVLTANFVEANTYFQLKKQN